MDTQHSNLSGSYNVTQLLLRLMAEDKKLLISVIRSLYLEEDVTIDNMSWEKNSQTKCRKGCYNSTNHTVKIIPTSLNENLYQTNHISFKTKHMVSCALM